MNKLPSLASLVPTVVALVALATLAACATGTTTDSVTGDISLTEADAAIDASGSRLPPRSDAGGADPDGASNLDDAGPDAALDAAVDAADAAVMPDSSTTSGACGAGFVEIGEYATWSGKVNVHRPTAGAWSVDTDCTSGANVNTVSYCQKFWPTTTKQVQLGAVTSDTKPFTSGGGVSPACGGVAPPGYPGQNQFACCAP
ncbi:MAG: hypothetical protein JWM74_6098 [Myxococcaceae bacterium]|nr:hypothetical protein [Myxococcaceae bacterium]